MKDLKQEYALAYVEVLEMIENMPEEIRKKIPKQEIEVLKENKDKNYKFKYDSNLSINEQDISESAKATLLYLYNKYIKIQG